MGGGGDHLEGLTREQAANAAEQVGVGGAAWTCLESSLAVVLCSCIVRKMLFRGRRGCTMIGYTLKKMGGVEDGWATKVGT